MKLGTKKYLMISTIALVALGALSVTAYAISNANENNSGKSEFNEMFEQNPNSEAAVQQITAPQPVDLTQAAENSIHAVVHIKSTQLSKTQTVQEMPDIFDFFFGDGRGQQRQIQTQPRVGFGSGVIISQDGYIVTNNHVVEGAKEIKVFLPDGRSMTGKVLGTDPATDLAVVKIDAKDLPEAPLGDSSSLQVGEPAIAIGNPLGMEFRGTVTVGIISALNRSIEVGERKYTLIQTDAAINPGNSGGALVNADGEVMGINSAKIAKGGVEGIGFAIPINTAKPILEELSNRGTVARPYLGVTLIDKATAEKMGFDMDLHGGVFMMKVLPNSPAGKAGIRPGDIILSFNGAKVANAAELRQKIAECKVGASVEVKILRSEVEMTKKVVLEEVPEEFNK